MTKPHEQNWEVHPHDARCVVRMNGAVIADIRAPVHEDGREVAALISAAPDMALALLAVLQSGVNSTWIDDVTGEKVDMQKMARASLVKAGVPCP